MKFKDESQLMALAGNNNELAGVVYRRPAQKHAERGRRENGVGGATSARNSWSYAVETPAQFGAGDGHEGYYADAEHLVRFSATFY